LSFTLLDDATLGLIWVEEIYFNAFSCLYRSSGPTAELPQQTFEIDLETEGKDEVSHQIFCEFPCWCALFL